MAAGGPTKQRFEARTARTIGSSATTSDMLVAITAEAYRFRTPVGQHRLLREFVLERLDSAGERARDLDVSFHERAYVLRTFAGDMASGIREFLGQAGSSRSNQPTLARLLVDEVRGFLVTLSREIDSEDFRSERVEDSTIEKAIFAHARSPRSLGKPKSDGLAMSCARATYDLLAELGLEPPIETVDKLHGEARLKSLRQYIRRRRVDRHGPVTDR